MNKHILLFYFFTLIINAQVNISLDGKLDIQLNQFYGIDINGNYYYSKQNTIFKKTPNSTQSYQATNFGMPHSVEVFNELNVLLFYKNSNRIVVLDKQWNEIKTVYNSNLLFDWIKPASQNEFWFFDVISQKIGLYNLNTNSYRLITNVLNQDIIFAYSDYNSFYFITNDFKEYQIDKFGRISFITQLPEIQNISFDGFDEYVYQSNNQMYWVKNKQVQFVNIPVDIKTIRNFCLREGKLLIFTANQVEVYQLKLK